MEKIKHAEHITAIDLAKALGVEKEYNDILFKEELNENYKIIMSEDNDTKDKKDKNSSITKNAASIK